MDFLREWPALLVSFWLKGFFFKSKKSGYSSLKMLFQRMVYLDILELFKIGEEFRGYKQEGTVHSLDDGSITGCSWVLTSLKGDGEEKSFQI